MAIYVELRQFWPKQLNFDNLKPESFWAVFLPGVSTSLLTY